MSDITLHVAGVELGGWTSIRVSASLESAARTFGFELATAEKQWLGPAWHQGRGQD
jgi:prophage tail gpP-like protein